MWARGRVDVLCVDGLCLLQTVCELLFSAKQALQATENPLMQSPDV